MRLSESPLWVIGGDGSASVKGQVNRPAMVSAFSPCLRDPQRISLSGLAMPRARGGPSFCGGRRMRAVEPCKKEHQLQAARAKP